MVPSHPGPRAALQPAKRRKYAAIADRNRIAIRGAIAASVHKRPSTRRGFQRKQVAWCKQRCMFAVVCEHPPRGKKVSRLCTRQLSSTQFLDPAVFRPLLPVPATRSRCVSLGVSQWPSRVPQRTSWSQLWRSPTITWYAAHRSTDSRLQVGSPP